jgi:hypothetical protein
LVKLLLLLDACPSCCILLLFCNDCHLHATSPLRISSERKRNRVLRKYLSDNRHNDCFQGHPIMRQLSSHFHNAVQNESCPQTPCLTGSDKRVPAGHQISTRFYHDCHTLKILGCIVCEPYESSTSRKQGVRA